MLKKLSKIVVLAFALNFLMLTAGQFIGINNEQEVHAAKKKMTQKIFNKEASKLSKSVKSYKSEQLELVETLYNNRLSNASNFGLFFEEDTLGLSDDELIEYYLGIVQKFADRDDILEEYFHQDEIDIIADYMYDIQSVNTKITKLLTKIKEYETKYNSSVKSKKYDSALKVRKDQIKAYKQLGSILEEGINLEYELYYETEELFEYISYPGDEYEEEEDYEEDYEEEYEEDYEDDYENEDDYSNEEDEEFLY
ncbi:hypothetical protein SM124_09115 [Bacillus sp. 31A1R]|uniref:Uncharacterized protein n=1 Tax=Robertmurraya mangrovi TaxID=3098077 RepID=A0ABU5IXQ6_9BACI|nr:hypothetical protein [Bacillus sp. 31A1R]MDZ5471906.1 hypothetical protein [Bacillus sp. 31A1R]